MIGEIGMRKIEWTERCSEKISVQCVEQDILTHGSIHAGLKTVLFCDQSFREECCLNEKHQAEEYFNESLFLQVF